MGSRGPRRPGELMIDLNGTMLGRRHLDSRRDVGPPGCRYVRICQLGAHPQQATDKADFENDSNDWLCVVAGDDDAGWLLSHALAGVKGSGDRCVGIRSGDRYVGIVGKSRREEPDAVQCSAAVRADR